MTNEEFNKIIDFAILREQEAVGFYAMLQDHARFADQKQMMRDFENMERGHIKILENVRKKGVDILGDSKTSTMRVSDYTAVTYDEDNLSYENIIIIAMKREEKAYKLYKDIANSFEDGEIKKIFNHLAAQEIEHKTHFSDMYDDQVLKEN
jgi:rubrerythrin